MSIIKPFKAVFYNTKKVKDVTLVMAPPYDVISPEMQTQLQNQSAHNFTHIDLPKDKANDDGSNNRFSRAKDIFQDWLNKNVLIQDDKPSVYFYKQEYVVMGQKYSRLGFVSLLKLKDDKESKVKPHEKTHKSAVDDRFNMTKALSSNLSCIFVCYSDQHRKVEKIFNKIVSPTEPMFDFTDDDQVHHRMWKLDDPDLISEINNSVDGQNLFIADGHHRYQVACDYRQSRLERKTSSKGDEDFNYVMTYFTNIDSKDLKIFPMHRIVKKIPKKMNFLEDFFRIDKIKSREELLILLAKAGRNEHAFGLYTKNGIQLLRLKNKGLIKDHVKEGSEEYKGLDATILKCFVFDKVGVVSDDIMYTKDIDECFDMVDQGKAEASFIMNEVKISQLKAIALNGERMPPKTTYFYPKVKSGLTVYKMD